MEPLIIEETADTPRIDFDPRKAHFEISGRSYPEDTHDFYAPVLKWMDDYCQKPGNTIDIIFKFQYFNSSTYKPIFDILSYLENLKGNKIDVKVTWLYKDGDIDMREAGEEFAELLNLPFSIDSFK